MIKCCCYSIMFCMLNSNTILFLHHFSLCLPMLPIAKNTTAVSRIYHKLTTNIPQYTTKHHKSITKQHNNVIQPQKKECFATRCKTLPHSVVFSTNNPTTNCSILLHYIICYHTMVYYTANSTVSITEVVFYHVTW